MLIYGKFEFCARLQPRFRIYLIFLMLRSWSAVECMSKFVHRDDGHQIDTHNQMHNSTSKPPENVHGWCRMIKCVYFLGYAISWLNMVVFRDWLRRWPWWLSVSVSDNSPLSIRGWGLSTDWRRLCTIYIHFIYRTHFTDIDNFFSTIAKYLIHNEV